MYDYDICHFEFDTNGDGINDTFIDFKDTTNDGYLDTTIITEDTTGNGYLDTTTVISDTDKDGFVDTQMEIKDTTGNGEPDSITYKKDTNHDGYLDTNIITNDTDNNGIFDYHLIVKDTTGSGYADYIAKAYDYNQDGKIDSITKYEDTNLDHQYDYVTKQYDSTGDGKFDTVKEYTNTDGGPAPVYVYDPSTKQIIPTMEPDFGFFSGTMHTDLENFTPDASYPNGISGNPVEAMNHWEYQEDTNRCALYAQKFAIEELTGQEIDIEEFATIAKENGWFTEEEGTSFLNTNKMLDYYGIKNEMSFHNSIDDIENCLNNGGKVIVSIDANEIWFGHDNNIFSPASSANHAVEVIGVDRSDPEHPMVILNDSGNPNGRGEMIPLDIFEATWGDGDCQMIACYPNN